MHAIVRREGTEMDTRISDEIAVQKRPSYGSFLKSHFRDYGMLLSLLLIMAFFQVVTGGTLLNR